MNCALAEEKKVIQKSSGEKLVPRAISFVVTYESFEKGSGQNGKIN